MRGVATCFWLRTPEVRSPYIGDCQVFIPLHRARSCEDIVQLSEICSDLISFHAKSCWELHDFNAPFVCH